MTIAPARTHACREQDGFTLIEVLVVVLIIGILAAIGIAVLLSQTTKAKDVTAKAQVRIAETAAETYATDRDGEYTGLSIAALQEIEPTLREATTAKLIKAEAKAAKQYIVESETLPAKAKFSAERTAEGSVVRKCEPAKTGGCPEGGEW